MRNLFLALVAIFTVNIAQAQVSKSSQASEYESLSAVERQIVHVKINADGSSEEIEELTILVKSQQAVETRSQADIPFSSDHQSVEVLEAYTILPDGQKN